MSTKNAVRGRKAMGLFVCCGTDPVANASSIRSKIASTRPVVNRRDQHGPYETKWPLKVSLERMHEKRSTLLRQKIKSVPALHPVAVKDDSPFAAVPLLEIERKRAMAEARTPRDQVVRVANAVCLSPGRDYITRKAIIPGSAPESGNPFTEFLRACLNSPLVNVLQRSSSC